MGEGFPEDVRHFITAHITSVDQLETLLLLHRGPEREWTAAAVSRELYTQLVPAAARLADLHARGFLAVHEGTDRGYCYAPANPTDDALVRRLAEVYKERRVAVIGLIYSKPLDQVQAFADAFRLRKGE